MFLRTFDKTSNLNHSIKLYISSHFIHSKYIKYISHIHITHIWNLLTSVDRYLTLLLKDLNIDSNSDIYGTHVILLWNPHRHTHKNISTKSFHMTKKIILHWSMNYLTNKY